MRIAVDRGSTRSEANAGRVPRLDRSTPDAEPLRAHDTAMPEVRPPADLLALQRLIAQRSSPQADGGPRIQAKLTVGNAGDRFEQQADDFASEMMRSEGGGADASSAASASRLTPVTHAETPGWEPASPVVEAGIASIEGRGAALPPSDRHFFEGRTGLDLEHIRVHTDSRAAELCGELNARAFTVRNDIAFNAGQYVPGTSTGRQLLAHEIAHTVQQGAGTGAIEAARIQRDELAWKVAASADPAFLKYHLDLKTKEGNVAAYQRLDGRTIAQIISALEKIKPDGYTKLMIGAYGDATGVNLARIWLTLMAVHYKGQYDADGLREIAKREIAIMTAKHADAEVQEVLNYMGSTAASAATPAQAPSAGDKPSQATAPGGEKADDDHPDPSQQQAGAATGPGIKKVSFTLDDKTPVVLGTSKSKKFKYERTPAQYANEILDKAGVDGRSSWFSDWGSSSFLGFGVGECHVELLNHLAEVEKKFMADPELNPDGKATKREVGVKVGLKQDIGGGRPAPTSAKISMHLFGLAIDVNYNTNPFVGESKAETDKVNEMLKYGGQLVGPELKSVTFAIQGGTSTASAKEYQRMLAIDKVFEEYVRLVDAPDEDIQKRLDAVPDGNIWKGKTPADVKARIKKDFEVIAHEYDPAKPTKLKRAGMLERTEEVLKKTGLVDLSEKLVAGLELNWGGNSYGDMMHFDMRNKGKGAKIYSAISAYKANITKELDAQEKEAAAEAKEH